jgi:DNA-binding XRE family transcriptional regulator
MINELSTIDLLMINEIRSKQNKEKKPKEKLHSNRIKAILEEIGMSQQELADVTFDGNSGYISRIIHGQRRCISLPVAFKIAEALGKPIEEVFIYKSKTTTNNSHEETLDMD